MQEWSDPVVLILSFISIRKVLRHFDAINRSVHTSNVAEVKMQQVRSAL